MTRLSITHGNELPARFRQPGESWHDWDCRNRAENTERLLSEKHLKPLRTGSLGLAVGVGTYDTNGNPKGSGWW